MNLTQEWSRLEEMKCTHMTMETIPKQCKRHWRVFSEKLSKRFPPNRNPNMSIKFLPNAPTSIKCKPYPRSKAEGEVKEAWLKEEKVLGRIKEGPSQFVSLSSLLARKTAEKSMSSSITGG